MRIANLAQRFGRDARAAVSVEFAMIMPLMLTFLLASVEVPGLLWARADVSNAAGALGDLAAQSSAIDENAAEMIFRAANGVLDGADGGSEDFAGRLTAVLACRCIPGSNAGPWCFSVLWSHAYASGALSEGFEMDEVLEDVPQNLATAENDTIIIAEASLAYAPLIDFVLQSGVVSLQETGYFRPRSSREVTHIGAQARETPRLCPTS